MIDEIPTSAALDIIGDEQRIGFSVIERPAEALISRSLYDEKGIIVGQRPEEEYGRLVAEAKGRTFFECRAQAGVPEIDEEGRRVIVQKGIAFQGAVVEHEMRGGAMAEMFAAFGSALFTQFFK